MEDVTFGFTVLGRYQSDLRGSLPHVTVNVTAGEGDHLTYCGTLTMSELEWDALVGALQSSLGGRVEVTDRRGSS